MKQENNILINIIGTGYDICVGEVSAPLDELFERISKEKKLSPHDFLFDDFQITIKTFLAIRTLKIQISLIEKIVDIKCY